MGGVLSTRAANHDVGCLAGLVLDVEQTASEAGGLDQEGFAATFVPLGRIRRHEGVRVDVHEELLVVGTVATQRFLELNRAERLGIIVPTVAPGGDAFSVGCDRLEVHIAHKVHALEREAFPLTHNNATFGDQGLTVPGEIRRGFTEAGGRVELHGDASTGVAFDELCPVVALPDGDVARAQVGEHGCTVHGCDTARRHRDPDVLAHVRAKHEVWVGKGLDEQVCADRGMQATELHLGRDQVRRVSEVSLLVELSVVREVALGCHGEDPATQNGHGAVENHAITPNRHTDLDEHVPVPVLGLFKDVLEGVFGRIEQNLGEEQVTVRVASEAKLRAHSELCAHLVDLPEFLHVLPGVFHGVSEVHERNDHSDAEEAVATDVEEGVLVERDQSHGVLLWDG